MLETIEALALVLALALASLAAVMSSGPQEERWVSNYIVAALTPTIVDIGPYALVSDPENLNLVTPRL